MQTAFFKILKSVDGMGFSKMSLLKRFQGVLRCLWNWSIDTCSAGLDCNPDAWTLPFWLVRFEILNIGSTDWYMSIFSSKIPSCIIWSWRRGRGKWGILFHDPELQGLGQHFSTSEICTTVIIEVVSCGTCETPPDLAVTQAMQHHMQ